MIYGIVPVGGAGVRLGLPFPKELFPLKGKDRYYPVCQHTIDNMLFAGCEKIVFVHGKTYKKHITDMYQGEMFVHVNNMGERQSEIFSYFLRSIHVKAGDTFLYGLPDSWYTENLFPEMLTIKGIVCGMFTSGDESTVDRLDMSRKFVKCKRKDESVSIECWGVLKFDHEDIVKFVDIIENSDFEVAAVLNKFNFQLCYGSHYFDLGTWNSMNEYWRFEP